MGSDLSFTAMPCLLFRWHGLLYGVNAATVQEILWLPELKMVAEAPDYVVGALNLRGKIVPVLDLDLRCGVPASPNYSVSDLVMVLACGQQFCGIIVNEICDVHPIAAAQIEAAPRYGQDQPDSRLSDRMAKIGEEIVMLINGDKLLADAEPPSRADAVAHDDQSPRTADNAMAMGDLPAAAVKPIFCPNAIPQARAIFHERATAALALPEMQTPTDASPFAIVGINGEYFGVAVGLVAELADLGHITQIPCCPPHVVGKINLRGEILTVVDVRPILKMPVIPLPACAKVIVVAIDNWRLGIVVDDVFEVVYLGRQQISPQYHTTTETQEYLAGTTFYEDKVVAILDVEKLLAREALVVNEGV